MTLWAQLLIAVVLAGGAYVWGRIDGSHSAAAKQLDAVLDAQAEQTKQAEKLQRTLDRLPKSEGAIREIVRENPSKCVRPPAVAKRVQQAIRAANAARALPAHP